MLGKAAWVVKTVGDPDPISPYFDKHASDFVNINQGPLGGWIVSTRDRETILAIINSEDFLPAWPGAPRDSRPTCIAVARVARVLQRQSTGRQHTHPCRRRCSVAPTNVSRPRDGAAARRQQAVAEGDRQGAAA